MLTGKIVEPDAEAQKDLPGFIQEAGRPHRRAGDPRRGRPGDPHHGRAVRPWTDD
ncbi:hypothetical protein ACRAWD_31480 [Caulobacter segnis]